MQDSAWFESWFDSPYYHILYKHRSLDEAHYFIDNITSYLTLAPGAKVLDLACGAGRHSLFLSQKGYEVTGIDLSEKNILNAKMYEADNLEFYQADMRKIFRTNYFDAVFNFFSSFGYFDNDHDHQLTINNVAKELKFGSSFVIDYANIVKVRETYEKSRTTEIDDIVFHEEKWLDDRFIYKKISFKHRSVYYNFIEKLRLFALKDFESMFVKAGLKIVRTFGGYDLADFDENKSDRLIIHAVKIS